MSAIIVWVIGVIITFAGSIPLNRYRIRTGKPIFDLSSGKRTDFLFGAINKQSKGFPSNILVYWFLGSLIWPLLWSCWFVILFFWVCYIPFESLQITFKI